MSRDTSQPSKLYCVIYSELMASGGGRQTWLQYFVPAIADTRRFNEIVVYFLTPKNNAASVAHAIDSMNVTGTPIRFVPVAKAVPRAGDYLSSGLNLLRFCSQILKMTQLNPSDQVLLIGSFPEGIAGLLLKLRYGSGAQLLLWIRGLLTGDLKQQSRHSLAFGAEVVERLTLISSSKIITNGIDTHNYYLSKHPQLSTKMHCIPNAVDYNFFADLTLPDFTSRPLNIGFLGRLAREKGFGQFLQSINRFNQREDNPSKIHFHCFGPGETSNLSIPANLHLHGATPRAGVRSALEKCHAFVLLNQSGAAAGLSHSLLEAMAAGRLLIAWDNVIHNQVLGDEHAILVPEGNIQSLANAYVSLLDDEPQHLSSMAALTRREAERYSIDSHVNNFLNLLNEFQ